jgi:hypothetical protein
VKKSQPTVSPLKSSSNVKPLVSSHGIRELQLMQQAALIEGSVSQYLGMRISGLFKVNQSQSTVLPVLIVSNVKEASSAHV